MKKISEKLKFYFWYANLYLLRGLHFFPNFDYFMIPRSYHKHLWYCDDFVFRPVLVASYDEPSNMGGEPGRWKRWDKLFSGDERDELIQLGKISMAIVYSKGKERLMNIIDKADKKNWNE